MSTRDDVLRALRDAGSHGVSGEGLAGELGVSRVAVAKHVKALRAEGYAIDAELGTGYVLSAIPDAPLPAEVASQVKSALWQRFEGGGETSSTNDDARTLAREGAADGTVVLASRQTAGRGRLGRQWVSPAGGAYFSAVLRPGVGLAEVSALSLVVGIGIARGLTSLGIESHLKWPNDVQLGGGKVAGVLLEMAAEADAVEWVVVGVGLNVRRDPASPSVESTAPESTAPESAAPDTAAFLSDAWGEIRIASAVAAVLDGISEVYAEWLAAGFAGLRGEYESRLSLLGESVTVRDRDGMVRGSGVVVGVDAGGRLRLASAAGESVIAAGEVTLREPA